MSSMCSGPMVTSSTCSRVTIDGGGAISSTSSSSQSPTHRIRSKHRDDLRGEFQLTERVVKRPVHGGPARDVRQRRHPARLRHRELRGLKERPRGGRGVHDVAAEDDVERAALEDVVSRVQLRSPGDVRDPHGVARARHVRGVEFNVASQSFHDHVVAVREDDLLAHAPGEKAGDAYASSQLENTRISHQPLPSLG
eukprot:30294-Pelagococcus_subviridis.AAC.30